MTLLNTENIALFKNLSEINDGFRIPDKAYVHGKDFVCFEQLGGDLYFSNFWYGKKSAAEEFAETLATYFKEKYDEMPLEEGDYDFYGMIVLWYVGDKALIANINLQEELAFYNHDSGIPEELIKAFEKSGLQLLLADGNDNSPMSVFDMDCDESVIKELLSCVEESSQESYVEEAKEKGINI